MITTEKIPKDVFVSSRVIVTICREITECTQIHTLLGGGDYQYLINSQLFFLIILILCTLLKFLMTLIIYSQTLRFTNLWQCTIVPNISMVGETIVDISEITLLDVLLDWIHLILRVNLNSQKPCCFFQTVIMKDNVLLSTTCYI